MTTTKRDGDGSDGSRNKKEEEENTRGNWIPAVLSESHTSSIISLNVITDLL